MITKQQLGNFLWGMADILYGKVEDYKSYILTLLFYKRLSDNYPWEEKSKVAELEAEYGTQLNAKQLEKALKNAHIFQIPDGCFWEDISSAPLDDKNEKIDFALNAIADANPKLKGIINTVKWNEAAPDGSGGKRLDPKILQELINHLDPMDLSNTNVPLDILGHAYEYLIKRFADENKGGTVAGQFYTPPEVVELMVRYLSPTNGMRVYDPTCGSGGFLIKAADYVKETQGELKGLRLYGQETIWNTWAIATMNLQLHGLEGEIRQGDTIQNPKFKKNDNEIETFDVVLANFPFSVENWAGNGTPKKDKKGKAVLNNDGSPKYDYPAKDTYVDPYNRLIYGTPNFTNGDFAFLQHIIASLEPNGMAGVVCPNGVLFKGQPEKTEDEDGQNRKADDDYLIRRGFIEGIGEDKKNIIDAIVALPENVFYGNTIPGAIVFFNKNKPEERKDKILMVWGAKEGWYKSEPDQNVLRPQDVMRLLVQLLSYGDIDKAKAIIPAQEKRLFALVDDNLDFKLLEINEKYHDEEATLSQLHSELLQAKTYFEADNGTAELTLTDGTILIASIHKGKFEFELKDKRKTTIPVNDKDEVEILFGAEQIFKLKLKNGNKATITQANINAIESRIAKLEELLLKKESDIADAKAEAQREKTAIQKVSQEMLEVFADPILCKKYFSLVDIDEVIENEFNLNLPRYIDTVEKEPIIPIQQPSESYSESFKSFIALSTEMLNKLSQINFDKEYALTELSKLGECNPEFTPMKLKKFLVSNDAGKWGNEPTDDDDDVFIVRSTNFNDTGYLDLSNVAVRKLSKEDFKKTKLEEGDILIERSGGSANQPVGRVSFIPAEVAERGFGFSNFIQRIKVSDEYNSKFVFYCLYYLHSAGITQTMQTQTNGIRNLEYRYYLNQLFPNPKKEEQEAIAESISFVDDTIKSAKNMILELETLKKSLMQNLLTGKLRIPQEAFKK